METEPLMDEEAAAAEEEEVGQVVPYAHRDIKPGILALLFNGVDV